MGTYNPDKYILGNITKPNKKTFVNYDKDKVINKGNNTKININNIKNNKETYAYVSDIMVPTIEAEVKPIKEILKEIDKPISIGVLQRLVESSNGIVSMESDNILKEVYETIIEKPRRKPGYADW